MTVKRFLRLRAVSAAAVIMLGSAGCAQASAVPEPPRDTAGVINIWPGRAPGSETWTQQEQVSSLGPSRVVRNVVNPTLTVFRPDPGKANKTAIIVAPGGGFKFLSIDSEGYDVARWLVQRGITVFVLRYRVEETARDEAGFRASVIAFLTHLATLKSGVRGPDLSDLLKEPGVADGAQAVRYLHTHAADLGIDPHRIGFVGFSAGGIVGDQAALSADAEARPDFVGSIYAGQIGELRVMGAAPPLFVAVAADDPLMNISAIDLYFAWRKAGRPAELHVYERGGHGFGMNRQGSSSDHWIDDFGAWLQARGLIKGAL
ncbi:MAG TPA: alpha/beta hydrolase [Caulobacteraceae bacterium]|jgi:acetyl esterase/lipase|nr:alpha/beta hydrolase [Caulobacteraceae bacterium]